jgi:hypothetical protein
MMYLSILLNLIIIGKNNYRIYAYCESEFKH